jgi:hypothetical protein
MILGIAAFACFTAIFVLLLFLVHQLRPKTFKVKAAITKWISVEVELESPESTNRGLPSAQLNRQQETAASAPAADAQDDQHQPPDVPG